MAGIKSPDRITPLPFNNGEEYLRLLREAQRESNQSSRVVSLASSRRDTPRDSPKSPPNSPQSELCPDDELRNVYINYWTKVSEVKYKLDFKQNNLTIYLYISSILYAQHRLAINKRSIMGIGCRTGIAASMSSHQSESHNNIDKYRNWSLILFTLCAENGNSSVLLMAMKMGRRKRRQQVIPYAWSVWAPTHCSPAKYSTPCWSPMSYRCYWAPALGNYRLNIPIINCIFNCFFIFLIDCGWVSAAYCLPVWLLTERCHKTINDFNKKQQYAHQNRHQQYKQKREWEKERIRQRSTVNNPAKRIPAHLLIGHHTHTTLIYSSDTHAYIT